jgi:hypothetical protein
MSSRAREPAWVIGEGAVEVRVAEHVKALTLENRFKGIEYFGQRWSLRWVA